MIDLGPAQFTPLGPADAGSLAQACAAIDPWKRMAYPAETLRHFLSGEEPGLRIYALRRDGELAGGVVIRDPWLKGPYLQFLAVLPQAQGQGVGSAVLSWMEAEAGTARNLWVLASDFNARALAFYRRHGFEPVAPLPDVAADGFTEILMRKRLTPPS